MTKPFSNDNEQPSIQSQKIGLKKVSTQKSIFDSMPKKPTQDDLDQRVRNVETRVASNKSKGYDLAVQFFKTMADKTLPENKNMLQKEMEQDLLKRLMQFAIAANTDIAEKEGSGSLSLITILMNLALKQRDKINLLEYKVSILEKKSEPAYLSALISKEIAALDNKKKSE